MFDSHDSDSDVCKWHATSVILLKYLTRIQIWYLGYLLMQPGRAPSAPCLVANVRNVCRINKKVLISNRQQKDKQPKFNNFFYFRLLIELKLSSIMCVFSWCMCSTADGSFPLLLNCHILKHEIRHQQFSKSIQTFHTENVSIPSRG